MIYGFNNELKRIKASPGAKAICPSCKEELIAKCGEIKIWHFAHRSIDDCDSWHQNETLWHIDWKEAFSPDQQEIALGQHRADVKINGVVLEFQHSSISASEIAEREHFYQQMIWILDASQWELNWFAVESLDRERFYIEFWFDKQLKTWARAQADIILHLGDNELIWTRKIDWCSGYGQGVYITRNIFLERCHIGNFSRPQDNLYNHILFNHREFKPRVLSYGNILRIKPIFAD